MRDRTRSRTAPHLAIGAAAAAILAAAIFGAAIAAPAPAAAATVSGVVKGATGYKLVLVQANGKARKTIISSSSGAFSLRGAALAGASLNLVDKDGSFYGPILLKASATKAYGFIKGAANLNLGAVGLKGGYAVARRAPLGRYQTLAAYVATAAGGKPIGAGKLGRVKTGRPLGLRGSGGDLDLDGIVNAFDIDDNGNRIVDNVDRTGRGANRPDASGRSASPALAPLGAPRRIAGGPPPLTPLGALSVWTNFWPRWPTSINANIATITDLDGLIERNIATALCLGLQAPDGTTVDLLDGLGNSYIAQHTLDGMTYPQVGLDYATPTYTPDGLLDLVPSPRFPSGCPVMPGALATEILAGDCFVLTTADGARYPGTLNFVFNTAPALKSYRFDTEAATTEVVYDENGVRPEGNLRFTVPRGAHSVTLTFWRPQRRAAPGEAASAAGWVDIGKLWYEASLRQETMLPQEALSGATANGAPIPPSQYEGGFIDPAVDLPADPGHTIAFTLDFAKAFPTSWSTFASGKELPLDFQCSGGYGDNAMIGLWFVLE